MGLLDNKVVIITGAGSGVGRAGTQLFTQHGAKVLALDISAERVEETVREVTDAGGIAKAGICDVSNEKAVQAAVADAVRYFGRLDVIYNNAGITAAKKGGGPPTFMDTTLEDLEKLNAVNVGGVVNGCKAAILQFRSQGGGGVIVNTASVSGLIGFGGVLYGSTKGAVTTITRALAMEVASEGIRVNSVCPAAMMTNFGLPDGGTFSEELISYVAKLHPLGRTIDPMDCAKGALFLASDLSSNMTGVNMPIDGGLTSGVRI